MNPKTKEMEKMETAVESSNSLRSLREETRFSVNQLAKAVEMSKTYLWNVEEGLRKNLSLDKALKLSDFFNVSYEYLLSGNGAVYVYVDGEKTIITSDEYKKIKEDGAVKVSITSNGVERSVVGIWKKRLILMNSVKLLDDENTLKVYRYFYKIKNKDEEEKKGTN